MNLVVEFKVLKQLQFVAAPRIGWAEEDWVGLVEPMSSDRKKQRQCMRQRQWLKLFQTVIEHVDRRL